ncbi:MAG: D-2-hydroxyacid dehydrogenase [Anaerolineae bacterium]
MTRLLVCDPIDASAVEAIRELGIEVDVRDDITAEALAEIIGNYDAMIVRSRTKVREPLIDQATHLKLIVRAGVGLDNIDVAYAKSKGITVANTPAASTNAVAELTLGLMLSLARHIPRADATMKAGEWAKKALKGTELRGKTLGVIGYGRIGQAVGEKAKALGMEVLAHDPYVEHEDIVEFDVLLAAADYVTLHLPHMESTHHLLDAEAFAKMKPGARLIHAARGGIVDETALYEALVEGHVAGAALDVYSEEPPRSELLRKLVALPQVVATPHIGAGTTEAKARIGDEIVKKVKEHLI